MLKNFEQRWKKATKWSRVGQRVKKISPWHDDSLFKIERIPWILCPSSRVPNDDPSLWALKEEEPERWHVQVCNFNQCYPLGRLDGLGNRSNGLG